MTIMHNNSSHSGQISICIEMHINCKENVICSTIIEIICAYHLGLDCIDLLLYIRHIGDILYVDRNRVPAAVVSIVRCCRYYTTNFYQFWFWFIFCNSALPQTKLQASLFRGFSPKIFVCTPMMIVGLILYVQTIHQHQPLRSFRVVNIQ